MPCYSYLLYVCYLGNEKRPQLPRWHHRQHWRWQWLPSVALLLRAVLQRPRDVLHVALAPDVLPERGVALGADRPGTAVATAAVRRAPREETLVPRK